MKQIIASLIACLFLTSLAAATQRPEWVTFTTPEGRFSLQFPKEPKSDVRDVESKVGTLTMYTFAASSSTVSYMVSFADYLTVTEADRQQPVLDAIRDGVAEKLEAKIFQETKISIDGNPGREFLMSKTPEGSADLIYHWRAYIVGRRVYQVAAAYYKRDAKPSEVPKYFDSFRLLN